MKRCQENGLTYYGFDVLAPFPRLVHGVFTRGGGVSPPPCQGLNLAFVPEDPPANVRANLDLVARTLNLDRLAFVGQVHGNQALVLGPEDPYRPRQPEEVRTGFDALITAEPGLGLLVKVADCQGVVLFDPVREVVAVVHCGWRGSAADILGRTVARLEEEFGVRPADLRAGISPSLGPCCAEFSDFRTQLPPALWDYRVGESRFDFWTLSRDQLVSAGLEPAHVEIAGVCTFCTDEDFFSYRRDKVTGRFGVVAGLGPEG